ncbi:hypothetical protein THAOC_21754 [Thalassiosira oceanica]|uniref:Uncharacterized protein n=1 Tax=Thalassiosira oceanica TaxID=159749 RepID=K0RWJ0_THAOC|nr:hypothetical protein THAOC_21754 [Thalassiosira oceanica]|eukprot:EJK58143.1 hypothetical protein THAOC_21754 [Thalassiosira oceanica]
MSAASAWASGPTQSGSRADIPSARTASGKTLRIPHPTLMVVSPDAHKQSSSLSGWKPKFGRPNGHQRRRCPLCRGTIPPSQDEISKIKATKFLMGNTSHPDYEQRVRIVKQFEEEYGEDWDGTMIEYDSNIKERVNAKWEEAGNSGLLYLAAMNKQHDLMSYLLLNGADVNILESTGSSVLSAFCIDKTNPSQLVRLILSWGAELFEQGERVTKERKLAWRQEISAEGHVEIASLVSSELGGRRCEIVSAPKTHDDLVGKTCVVNEYIEISDQYKVRMEFTNEELLLGVGDLKRRDRTPQDPGYYVECKNNRLTRRDFKSNEECQAFIASLGAGVGELSKVDPDADAKAEQAAADLLAELGLEGMEGPSSSAPKKNSQPAVSGKKKKRGGKKKGRSTRILERFPCVIPRRDGVIPVRYRNSSSSGAPRPPPCSFDGRLRSAAEKFAKLPGSRPCISFPERGHPSGSQRHADEVDWSSEPADKSPSAVLRGTPPGEVRDAGGSSEDDACPSEKCGSGHRRPRTAPASLPSVPVPPPPRVRRTAPQGTEDGAIARGGFRAVLLPSLARPPPPNPTSGRNRPPFPTSRRVSLDERVDGLTTFASFASGADVRHSERSPGEGRAFRAIAIKGRGCGAEGRMGTNTLWASGGPVTDLPLNSSISGWKPKHAYVQAEEVQRKRCPLCRGAIPPSQEQISKMKMRRQLMENRSDPDYEDYARTVKQFEEEYGEDWDGTMIEYDRDFVGLPEYVAMSVYSGNFRTVLQWLGKGNVRQRVNAKHEEGGNAGLLYLAAMSKQHDLMSYMLLNGADMNILGSTGDSVLTPCCLEEDNPSKAVRLLLSWGAEHILKGEQVTKELKLTLSRTISVRGNVEIANLVSSELGGRRCEIVSAPNNRDDLVGKTCVVEEYVKISDQYRVKMEFTNEELLLGVGYLERRDRTPQDPGYYVECKNNRLIRRDFKSNEECRAFITSLGSDVGELSKVDPNAEAKAEQAAADLLAELGLEDMEGPSSSAPKKNNQSTSGKKKKGRGKKKGRNTDVGKESRPSFGRSQGERTTPSPGRRRAILKRAARTAVDAARSMRSVLATAPWAGAPLAPSTREASTARQGSSACCESSRTVPALSYGRASET